MVIKKSKSTPDFSLEEKWRDITGGMVAGIDEAGRGPWAGPVAAAAVILDPDNIPDGLNDSKKLSENKREDLFEKIIETSMVGVALAQPCQIDSLNILGATLWSMQMAVSHLAQVPDAALIDGNQRPDLTCPMETIIKGDAKCLSIAAASIIAKVTRDRIMRDLDTNFPEYGWARNKGYGTHEHAHALAKFGVTPHHRKSFAPIRRAIEANVGSKTS